jgi:hypothetical protein
MGRARRRGACGHELICRICSPTELLFEPIAGNAPPKLAYRWARMGSKPGMDVERALASFAATLPADSCESLCLRQPCVVNHRISMW